MPDQDPAQAILSPVQADNSVKADAWQAFKDSANEREYSVRLKGLNLPDNVKADLWEAKRKAGPQVSPEQQQIAALPKPALQAKQQVMSNIKPLIPGTATVDPTGGFTEVQNSPAYNEYMRQSGIMAGATAGTMGAGALVPAVKGLTGLALRAGASGAGAGAGSLAGGATPPEAGINAVSGVVAQPIAEGIGAVASKIPGLVKWLGASKSTGAQMLQQASAKAGSAPVALSPETDKIIEQITNQGKLGGTVPKVISDLLERIGPSTKQAADAAPGPLTYDEARIIQSNASTMSAQEQMALKGQLKQLIPAFAKSFSKDVQEAANQAGVGAEHASGMQEYANAASRGRVLQKAIKYGTTAAGTGVATDLLLRKLGVLK